MMSQIRNAASARRLPVSVRLLPDGVTIEAEVRGASK